MSNGQGAKDRSGPRLCEGCGSPLPPQKTGRPRRWCSQQCRQTGYEERNGLESWKDKQPKVSSLSDVVEVAQDRAAQRSLTRQRPADHGVHVWGDCVSAVCADQLYMAMVVDAVADLISDDNVLDNLDGRFLAGGVARLVAALGIPIRKVAPE